MSLLCDCSLQKTPTRHVSSAPGCPSGSCAADSSAGKTPSQQLVEASNALASQTVRGLADSAFQGLLLQAVHCLISCSGMALQDVLP